MNFDISAYRSSAKDLANDEELMDALRQVAESDTPLAENAQAALEKLEAVK